MNNDKLTALLTEHGVKPTANRIMIAKALNMASSPMSLSELERKMVTIDKSVISRALTLFREHQLVHVVEDGSGCSRFELCRSHDRFTDDDTHPHFHCERCGKTYCLEHIQVPQIMLPEGFHQHAVSYLVKGVCPHCGE